jgi:hypothetical protein
MTRTLAEIGEKFHAAAKHVAHAQWRGIPEDATDLVAREARAADLIIIGREHGAQTHYYDLDPGVTIVRAGRPVLLAASWWPGRIPANRAAPFAMQSRY